MRSLFERCLDLAPEQRAALLAAAPDAVRAEVETLLREDAADAEVLAPEAAHRQLAEATGVLVGAGSCIGRYRIVDVLGRGGMGTVYLAEQESPQRRVAVKLLAATMVGGEAERRFRHEAELLARLQHRGIAQILEAGVHEQATAFGVARWPYFALEYVEGARTLASWAAALPARDEAVLLPVFLQVCAAVQHSHERGVVHRDLKPQNVLVDRDGQVKVIDFGIARSLGDGARPLTRTGEFVGTLRYMSPEQVRGDTLRIDTRTDVHALGVMLFELLTGEVPFDVDGKSLPETGRILCEVAPRRLRQVCPEADPDLELILETATAKDPGRRYATAGALADDLQRYRQREPIDARAPSLAYQLRMFARRRRGLVAALAVILLLVVLGSAVSVVYALRARDAERQVRVESEQKVDVMRRVFDMAMASVVQLPKRLESVAGATDVRREMIEKAMHQVQFVEDNMPLDHAMRIALARAYASLGNLQGFSAAGHIGLRREALASFGRGCEHLRAVLADTPDDVDALAILANLELGRGSLHFDLGRDVVAARASWQVVGDALDRLQRAGAATEVVAGLRIDHLTRLGHLAQASGDADAALARFREAFDACRRLHGDGPPDEAASLELANPLFVIALIEQGRGADERALAVHDEALDILGIAAEHPENTQLRQLDASVHVHRGYLLASLGRTVEGEADMRRGYLELERLLALDPTNARLGTTLGEACQRLADHLSIRARHGVDPTATRQLWSEAREVASRGRDVTRPLRDGSPDMLTIFVVGECERIVAQCDDALR